MGGRSTAVRPHLPSLELEFTTTRMRGSGNRPGAPVPWREEAKT